MRKFAMVFCKIQKPVTPYISKVTGYFYLVLLQNKRSKLFFDYKSKEKLLKILQTFNNLYLKTPLFL
jgi:hypothetical protein